MTIEHTQFRDDRVDQLHWMLALPFIGQVGNYPLNRHGGGEKPPGPDASKVAAPASSRQTLSV